VPATTTAKPPRTQEQRRAATRQALLDAALTCLIEDGFGGLTTRRVAARADVSAATLRFYFPTRAAFVAAAVEQLAAELLRQHRERIARPASTENSLESWLDELWEICKGPAFNVMVELSSAARNDDDARDNFALAERALTKHIALAATDVFPEQIADPRFRTLIDLATASMRGLAMFLPVADRDDLDQRWRAARDELVRLYDGLPSSP
jgi:AcrR family transcriptional regulator